MQRNSILSLVFTIVLVALSSLSNAAEQAKFPLKYPTPPVPEKVTSEPAGVGGADIHETLRYAETSSNNTVLPEITTPVDMSATDLNRISCPSDIKDALTSAEKGVIVKISGKDVFVKFKVLKTPEGKLKYSANRTELFVVCGDSTYSLIAQPKMISSQMIRLGSGTEKRIQENQSIYGSLPFEKKIIRAIKDIYTEQIPDSYAVTDINRHIGNYQEFSVISRRSVEIEGEGLRVVEMEVILKPGTRQFKLNEKFFLNKQFTTNPVAVSLEKQVVNVGEHVRVFIVEQRPEKQMSEIKFTHLEKLQNDTSADLAQKPLRPAASRVGNDFKQEGGDQS